MKTITLKLIRIYQLFVNPVFKSLFSFSCRFSPTCSQYTYQAVKKYGTIKGLILGVKRIGSCHPFS